MANNNYKETYNRIINGDYKQTGNVWYSSPTGEQSTTIRKTYTAPTQTQKKKKKDGFFDNWVQTGAFEDGFQISDIPKTILGTGADIGLGIIQGIVAGGEGIGDLLTYGASGVSKLFGNEELANQLKENAKINATEEIFGVVKNKTGVERNSVIGSKGDQVSNAIGTILTMTSTAGLGGAAGLGKVGQTVVSMGSMGASSVGSGMSEAYQGGATDEEAVKYGLISGAAEVGSEMLFGGLGKGAKAIGISKGLTGADDMLAKTISDKFKSQLAKNLAQYTVKAGAEGVEEVISGLAQAWGKKMTYMSEEDLAKLIQDEKLLDQFIVGMVSSGISQSAGLVKTTSKGQDYLTGYTQNEQKVYDALLQERINEEQSESKKPLTKKQINAIEEEFRQDFENGNISTKKIEEVLGYEDIYNNLKDRTENALAKTLTAQDEAGIREEAKQEYAKKIKDDEFLKKNYYEDTQRTKAYNVDVNQYDEKYRDTIQKAIDSGILNNSTKTHQFVDFISKLAADKGVTFDFTNNEALKNSSLGIDGATVNGYVNANGDITLNINSAKSLNSVVGHEITHVLEGSDLYQTLSDSLKEYAETKGEYAKRYNELQELYKNVDGADITKELNADLVGDYLFTNQEFINHLTQNRNLFQRIYDEIKYLVKQATAGSKEQRQLLKAQKMFEKAYKDNSVKLAEQEASTQPKYSITQDNTGRELSQQQQEYFKNSKARDEDGRLIELYHGTPNDFTKFNYDKLGTNGTLLGKGFYLTDDINVGEAYANKGDNGKIMKLYADIQKPLKWGEKSISKSQYKDFVEAINKETNGTLFADYSGEYSEKGSNQYNSTLNDILMDYEYGGDDIDLISGLLNSTGMSWEKAYRILKDVTGYDGIIVTKDVYDSGEGNVYIPFLPEQIKNVTNTNPTDNPDIRYSLSVGEANTTEDNNGNKLSKEQIDYFKDSKAVDENGNLITVYHGTNNAGFNIFNKNFNYYTDNKDIAQSYTGGNENASFERLNNIDDAKNWLDGVNEDFYIEGNNVYDYDGDTILEYSTNDELLRNLQYDLQKMYGDTKSGGYYEGYVNITNPLIIDVKGDKWSGIDINNIGIDNPKDFLDKYGSSTFKERGAIRTSTNDIVSAVLDAIDEGELNYDGVIFKNIIDEGMYANNSNNSVLANDYVTFNSNQFKNANNTTPTEDADIRYSMSKQNEEIAPTGDYNIYGKDIELQQTAPVRQDIIDLQNDIAAIKEDYRKQSEDIKKELQLLRQEREELDRGVNEVAPIDEYTPVESDIAPYESETAYPNTNVVPLDDKLLNKYKKYFKENFYFKGKQLDNAMKGIKELSANPELTQNDVYKYFKENFGKEETKVVNDAINELKSDLRYTEIGVSDEVKKDIAHRYDGFGNFRKKNFGKMKLVEYNGNNGVDQVYSDLVERFPGTVDPDIINPADQLVALSELANDKGYDTFFSEQPDELIRAYANEMYSMIKDYRNETTQKLAEEQLPLSYLEEIAPTQEEETIDDYYNNLNERITNLETELENIPKREYNDIQSREMDERLKERIVPEKRDILELINMENAKKNGKKVELVKPVVAKEKGGLKTAIDLGRTMFTNEFAEISNMAKDYNNQKLVHKADMLNNVTGEVQNSITTAQTDFNGNEIGEALDKIFDELRAKGLEAVGNDYLINWSNIDRWAKGKGSQTPLDVSQRIVANYEAKYPFLKRWATKVWQYGRNELENKYKSGMLSKKMFEYNKEAYPHYVPFVSDNNNLDSIMGEIKELKAKPIKRAFGGSTELTPIEKALANYTYSGRLAYRNNELYKEVFNTLNPGTTDIKGAEVGDDFYNSNETLYKNDDGYYVTAIFDGEERTTKISKELFDTLNRDMKHRVSNIEDKLSTLLKPVQGFSNIRRKILTTWSPTFLIKNVIKDIQDGLFNSKHTKGLVKNYLPGIKELMTRSTPEVRQYLALSGNEALRGDYESNLYESKKGLKNNKFLKALANMNEVMEQAPRYAEFKASLEAGDTLEQAMYNSREVTTNFARGGVITKALNRNGFTFLNASVQGFDKFIRNFSGENGAKGIANSLLKAVALGVVPAVFNELAFGGLGDDDKDEDYEALPDYIKDNYYLIKTGDGNFVRIPKGRVLSVFGSAARRTIEMAEGEEDAFNGYLSNVNNQIGINNPEENNIFSPFLQTFGSKNGTAWYGGDIVPSRLQDKPVEEQYDASTDKMSIWLGQHLGVSPYKINYLIDQYSGGIGDIVLPMITDEATSNGSLIAPLVDQFTADSTTDNKYVSDFYSKNDELKVKANGSKATDEDLVKNQYMYGVSKQMGELYAERRKVQEDNSLTKEQKYEKAQAIKKEINKLAKEGLNTYESGTITGNYAEVGNQEFYKNAKGKWTDVSDKDKENINSLGLNNRERDSYFKTSNELYNIDQRYKELTEGASETQKTKLNAQRKVDVINAVKSANLPDEGKATLYDKKYADTDTLNAVLDCDIDFDSYLDLQAQNFTADKDRDGKSISGSKKAKVYGYINSMNMPYEQKIMLAKLEYKSDNTYNNEIINYLNNDPTISYQDMTSILKAMGFKVDEYGNITW